MNELQEIINKVEYYNKNSESFSIVAHFEVVYESITRLAKFLQEKEDK
jgi:hypothetical protein